MLVAIVTLSIGLSVPPLTQARALPPGIHPTTNGIHVGQVFDYATPDPAALHGVDILWGASKSVGPGRLYRTSYTIFDRDDAQHTLAWWQTHHPAWVEYQCDRKTPAYEFGQTNYIPLNIANPAVRDYQWQRETAPALRRGYNGMAVDNLALNNPFERCGHFTPTGSWVSQYNGTSNDVQYRLDAIAWTNAMRRRIHRSFPGRTLAINFHYDVAQPQGENLRLMLAADIIFDEGGFTNYGASYRHVTTPSEWRALVHAIDDVQRAARCYAENNQEPETSRAITSTERLWAVANYLLTKDRCTWIAINGRSASGSQDYGRVLPYPEYRLRIGAPLGPRRRQGAVSIRYFTHGVAVVNPTDHAASVTLNHRRWRDTTGVSVPRQLSLLPESGSVLFSPGRAARSADALGLSELHLSGTVDDVCWDLALGEAAVLDAVVGVMLR